MSKGDKVVVTMNVGGAVVPATVEAMRNGSKVVVDDPRASLFFEVIEQDKNGNPVRTFKFAKSAVVSIAEEPRR